jgi:hypothetical protein
MGYVKLFENWLLENNLDLVYENGVDIALSSKIFGMEAKSLKFPFVLATTGTGDEDGFYDYAWKINSLEDLRKFIVSGTVTSKMFPGPDFEYTDENDVAEQLAEDSWIDDFSNGIRVDIYKDEKAMRDAEKISEEDWGIVDDYDEPDRDHRLIEGDLVPVHTMEN